MSLLSSVEDVRHCRRQLGCGYRRLLGNLIVKPCNVSHKYHSITLIIVKLYQIHLLSLEWYVFPKPTTSEFAVVKEMTGVNIVSLGQHEISGIPTTGLPPSANEAKQKLLEFHIWNLPTSNDRLALQSEQKYPQGIL